MLAALLARHCDVVPISLNGSIRVMTTLLELDRMTLKWGKTQKSVCDGAGQYLQHVNTHYFPTKLSDIVQLQWILYIFGFL